MADYIVSEEVLRQLLDCMNDHGTAYLGHQDEYATAVTTLAAILASPPAEPMAWMFRDDPKVFAYAGAGCHIGKEPPEYALDCIPLYRKDAP